MIKGSKPAHSMYGEPATRGAKPAQSRAGSRLAAASGEYLGRNLCMANNDTCNARKQSGYNFCAGHVKAINAGKDVS